jgi:hypothetical protein
MRQSALAFATFFQSKPGPLFLPGSSIMANWDNRPGASYLPGSSIITNLGIYKVSTDESKTSGSGR